MPMTAISSSCAVSSAPAAPSKRAVTTGEPPADANRASISSTTSGVSDALPASSSAISRWHVSAANLRADRIPA